MTTTPNLMPTVMPPRMEGSVKPEHSRKSPALLARVATVCRGIGCLVFWNWRGEVVNHETELLPTDQLPSIPGGWTTIECRFGDLCVRLTLPAKPDDFLDDADVRRANRESDYMPYWAYLWPASQAMSQLLLNENWKPGTRALELGTGVGLVGIAGLASGLDLTFSDYDRSSVEAAQRNAATNGFADVGGMIFDWRQLEEVAVERFEVILGCEVIYEAVSHPFVLDVLDKLLRADGVCWIADPGRPHVRAFCSLAESRGYEITLRDQTGLERLRLAGEFDLPRDEFRLIVLRRRVGQARPSVAEFSLATHG